MTSPSNHSVDGFSLAMVVPAIISSLKQAQREAEHELHVLAAYATRCDRLGDPSPLQADEEEALRGVGKILVEQGISGGAFFLGAQLALASFGVPGGVAAQVLITANAMLNPRQAQSFNPGKAVTAKTSLGNWVESLDPQWRQRVAGAIGAFALRTGYGQKRTEDYASLNLLGPPASKPSEEMSFVRKCGKIDWEAALSRDPRRGDGGQFANGT